jgi:hypothetical protein
MLNNAILIVTAIDKFSMTGSLYTFLSVTLQEALGCAKLVIIRTTKLSTVIYL